MLFSYLLQPKCVLTLSLVADLVWDVLLVLYLLKLDLPTVICLPPQLTLFVSVKLKVCVPDLCESSSLPLLLVRTSIRAASDRLVVLLGDLVVVVDRQDSQDIVSSCHAWGFVIRENAGV